MSAPNIAVFLPVGHDYKPLLLKIAGELHLEIEVVPPNSPFTFGAHRTDPVWFLIQYCSKASDVVEEMRQWERPSQLYKTLLRGCGSYIDVHYRDVSLAKQCIDVICKYIGQSSSLSVIENGNGCLLRLSDIVRLISDDPNWSWEREKFPELPEVADSEWIV
jgi:hypothetical protein